MVYYSNNCYIYKLCKKNLKQYLKNHKSSKNNTQYYLLKKLISYSRKYITKI